MVAVEGINHVLDNVVITISIPQGRNLSKKNLSHFSQNCYIIFPFHIYVLQVRSIDIDHFVLAL